MRLRATIVSVLVHRRLPWILAGTVVAGCFPALFTGFCADDWFLLAVLRGFPWPELRLGWWEMFSLVPAGPEGIRPILDRGWLPWWLPANAHIAFFRPLAAFSHLIDYRLFGLKAWVPHLENLLLYGALVALATIFFRRIMGSAAPVAGLAAVLYALDDAHSPAVGWIASRNTVLASLFGIGALLAHDAWRRGRWRPGAWLGPLCLLLGLLSGEFGLGSAGYLFAYAIFLEEDRRRALKALIPYAAVLAVWFGIYAAGGFGVRGSGLYLDPLHNPAEFLAAFWQRVPLLLQAQWGFIPVEHDLLAHGWPHWALLAFSVACGAAVILLVAPLLRRSAEARFWAFGSAAALVPIAATFPTSRLLFFVGLGGMALLALAVQDAGFLGDPAMRRVPRPLVVVFLIIHAVLSPLVFPAASATPSILNQLMTAAELDAPSDPDMPRSTLVLVSSQELAGGYVQVVRVAKGEVAPGRVRVLAPAYRRIRITREDEHTLRLRPDGGWFFYPIERLIRDDVRDFRVGDRIVLSGMQVEIAELTSDGRPAEVLARFEKVLEDRDYRWFYYRYGRLVPFPLPAPGASITLPPGVLLW